MIGCHWKWAQSWRKTIAHMWENEEHNENEIDLQEYASDN